MRARSGARSNALYVWLPLCLLFLVPFIDPRARSGSCTSTCWCCSASRSRSPSSTTANIGMSVPLVYPLLALPAGAHARGRVPPHGPAPAAEPLRLLVPPDRGWRSRSCSWSASASGLNVTDSNVIDVGYAGVIGADRLIHGDVALRRASPPTTSTATPTGRSTTTPTCRSSRSGPGAGSWDDLPGGARRRDRVRPADDAAPVAAGAAHPRARRWGSRWPTPGPPSRSRCSR